MVLQIRSIIIGTGLASPATLLIQRPIRGLWSQINREPININSNDVQYEAHKSSKDKYVKDIDSGKDPLSFPIWSTVAMQCEDGGPWAHGVIKEANNSDHKGRSYIISDKDGQTDTMEHKAHVLHPNNYRTVSLETVK